MSDEQIQVPDEYQIPNEGTTKISLTDELGITGLWQFSGYLDEEKLLQLRGWRGVMVFREMSDNDATIGAILFAFQMLLRTCDYRVEPGSDSPEDIEYAQFLEECMDDMSMTWEDHVEEFLTMLPFGWSCAEIVYKRRLGPDGDDPTTRSKYNDGCIGWRKLAPRAQETLQHWEFDEDGGVKGWWQQPPQGGGLIYLPIQKILLFRTQSKKNSPEGRSLLRNAYTAWYRKKNMERIEAIGMERDLAGMPMFTVPMGWLAKDADPATKANLDGFKKVLRNMRNDEQMGLIIPAIYDENKNQILKFELLSTTSRKTIDTTSIITRYTKDILTSVLADVLLLGQGANGSYALSESKTNLLFVAMGAILDGFCAVHNRYSIPRLFAVNNFKPKSGELPKLVHGDLDKQDMSVLAQAVLQLVQAGGLMLGQKDEEHLREVLGMPEESGTLFPQWQDIPNKNESDRLAALGRAQADQKDGTTPAPSKPVNPDQTLGTTPPTQAGIPPIKAGLQPAVAKVFSGRRGKFVSRLIKRK